MAYEVVKERKTKKICREVAKQMNNHRICIYKGTIIVSYRLKKSEFTSIWKDAVNGVVQRVSFEN
jgi:hypothetical protein